jgi:hypothetical protein
MAAITSLNNLDHIPWLFSAKPNDHSSTVLSAGRAL